MKGLCTFIAGVCIIWWWWRSRPSPASLPDMDRRDKWDNIVYFLWWVWWGVSIVIVWWRFNDKTFI